MLTEYYYALLFLLVVATSAGIAVFVSLLITRRYGTETRDEQSPYESGFVPFAATSNHFKFKYFSAILLSFFLTSLLGFIFLFATAFAMADWTAFFTVCVIMFLSGLCIVYAFSKSFLK